MKKVAKKLLTVTLLSGVTLLSQPAAANGDWFEKAKQMLGLSDTAAAQLSEQDITEGLKQTLSVGTQTVIAALSKKGGFSDNPDLRISLPDSLQGVAKALDKIGMGHWTTQLEDKLNQAAESAIPKAGPILLSAIKSMSLKDVQDIYQGGDDAATQFFKKTMSGPIGEEMTPMIKQSLSEVGALKTYEQLMEKYQSIPFLPDVSANLLDLVKSEAITGIFDNLAKEEAAIRQDPVKQTTDLLKKLYSTL
jgi:hypothetical protein